MMKSVTGFYFMYLPPSQALTFEASEIYKIQQIYVRFCKCSRKWFSSKSTNGILEQFSPAAAQTGNHT